MSGQSSTWWVISDEDGEFARVSDPGLATNYVLGLLIGPGTLKDGPAGRVIVERVRIVESVEAPS